MSDVEKLDPNLRRQYTGVYGPFTPGDYGIGDEIPGLGEVIWSYLSASKGIVYVCESEGFPEEIAASDVVA